MPNTQIDPSLSAALRQAFNNQEQAQPSSPGMQPQQQPAPGGSSSIWSALANLLGSNSQPQQQATDPYQNYSNKVTGQSYK